MKVATGLGAPHLRRVSGDASLKTERLSEPERAEWPRPGGDGGARCAATRYGIFLYAGVTHTSLTRQSSTAHRQRHATYLPYPVPSEYRDARDTAASRAAIKRTPHAYVYRFTLSEVRDAAAPGPGLAGGDPAARGTLRVSHRFFASAIFPLATVPSTDRALAADCKRM